MARPSHMAGMDALPKWDPNNLGAGYRYTPGNYDPQDYQRFKEARLAATERRAAASEKALKKTLADFQKFLDNEVKNAGKAMGEKQGPTRRQIKDAVAAGKTLWADTPSTCFASLSYSDGVAVAEFARGGTYTYPMELDEFLEWAQADSLGEYFNAEIR